MKNVLTSFWDWFDKRDVDKHAISIAIMYGTVRVTEWSMAFAGAHSGPTDALATAAVIAAVTTPYMALQAAAISFYFKSRVSS